MSDDGPITSAERLYRLRQIVLLGQPGPTGAFLALSPEPLPSGLLPSQEFKVRLMRVIVLRQVQRTQQAWQEAQAIESDVAAAAPDDAFFFYCEATRLALVNGQHTQTVAFLLSAYMRQHDVEAALQTYLQTVMGIVYSYLQNDEQQLLAFQQAELTPPPGHPYHFAWNAEIWQNNLGWILSVMGHYEQAQAILEQALNQSEEQEAVQRNLRAPMTEVEWLAVRAEQGEVITPERIADLRGRLDPAGDKLLPIVLTMIQALSALNRHDRQEAHKAFQAALNLGEGMEYQRSSLRVYEHALRFYREQGDLLQVIRLLELKCAVQEHLRERAASLFQNLTEQAQDLVILRRELATTRSELIDRLAAVGEYHDDATGLHTRRVANLIYHISNYLALPNAAEVAAASRLHDLGKVAIPDSILLKPGPLTPEERQVVEKHTTIGAEMLAGASSQVVQLAQTIARWHHERWDGSGYPDGLSGEQIPMPARIAAVADVFDALTSERPYKAAWTREATLVEMHAQANKQFDPQVLNALEAVLSAWHE